MRKYASIIIVILSAATFVFNGCYYDKAEVLFPPEARCETVNVKYSADILPVLNTYCKGCHQTNGNPQAANRWRVDSFPSFQARVLNGSVIDRITRGVGVPGHMPQGGPKLDTCTISKIISWKNSGAFNN